MLSNLKLKLSTKLLGMTCLIILTFCIAMGWLYSLNREGQFDNRRLKVKDQVETAWGVVDYYARQAKAGQLSVEEAQNQAKEVIKGLRYGDNDYFWINDMGAKMVMHPLKPALDGKDLSQLADPNGKKFFVTFIETCRKQGAGFVDYYWPKPGQQEPVAKISYVKIFPEWGWVVGNGLYVDDVKAQLAETLKVTWLIIAGVVLLTILLVAALSRSITRPLSRIREALRELALGHTDIDLPVGRPVNCSQEKNCGQSGCSSYGKVEPCWVTSGSFAVDKQCPRAQKGEDCKSCNLYGVRNEMEELGCSILALANAMEVRAELALQIANGDLTREVKVSSNKDALGTALAKMHESLSVVLCQVQATSLQIASDSTQISESSADLADGATQQASFLEEVSASMNQIASQTSLNAKNAEQANGLASQGRDAAENGNREMEGMMAAMAEISASGESISKIIKVIDEIAFQTNLLALNAAVEAARAGQHGKGFAVVAEEVRNLAARSAKAAKETEELIASSVSKTENGTVIAERTSTALKEIVGVSSKVSNLVGKIATSSHEQAQGIGEINQGLQQIDQVNQQTTARTEESASSAAVLAAHARELKELLNRFKLDTSLCSKEQPPRPFHKTSKSHPPRLVHSAAAQLVSKENWGALDEGKGPRPSAVIALDDDEFGKY